MRHPQVRSGRIRPFCSPAGAFWDAIINKLNPKPAGGEAEPRVPTDLRKALAATPMAKAQSRPGWVALGIDLERGRLCHPQDNGAPMSGCMATLAGKLKP